MLLPIICSFLQKTGRPMHGRLFFCVVEIFQGGNLSFHEKRTGFPLKPLSKEKRKKVREYTKAAWLLFW